MSCVQLYRKEINGGSSQVITEMKPNEHTVIVIPEYVKADGVFYRVSSVAGAAFKDK